MTVEEEHFKKCIVFVKETTDILPVILYLYIVLGSFLLVRSHICHLDTLKNIGELISEFVTAKIKHILTHLQMLFKNCNL